MSAPRFRMMLFLFAAMLAIGVSAVGVLSMQNYYLGQRQREFALRVALGASPGALERHGLASIAPSVALACVSGGALALYIARSVMRFNVPQASLFGDWLFGVTAMLVIAILASAPAIRAVLRVSPRELLSME